MEENKAISLEEVTYNNIVIHVSLAIEKRKSYSISKSYTSEDGPSGSIETGTDYWCARVNNLPVVAYGNSDDDARIRALRELQLLCKNLSFHGQAITSYLNNHGVTYSPIKTETPFIMEIIVRDTRIDICGMFEGRDDHWCVTLNDLPVVAFGLTKIKAKDLAIEVATSILNYHSTDQGTLILYLEKHNINSWALEDK